MHAHVQVHAVGEYSWDFFSSIDLHVPRFFNSIGMPSDAALQHWLCAVGLKSRCSDSAEAGLIHMTIMKGCWSTAGKTAEGGN